MKSPRVRRTSRAQVGAIERSQQAVDLRAASPDSVAESVRKALSNIPSEDRRAVNDRILAALNQARVNIGQLLLLLGIPAETPDELTAPELAKMVRYVRINDSKAMDVLLPVLREILNARAGPAQSLEISRHAA